MSEKLNLTCESCGAMKEQNENGVYVCPAAPAEGE